MKILVTGAGGFIGHHLVKALVNGGHFVRGVDLKLPEFETSSGSEFWQGDLRDREFASKCCQQIDWVYALAADMGGMGYLATHQATVLANNMQIDLNTFEAARLSGVSRVFYASSACIYPEHLQTREEVVALKEEDAYPAFPQDAYGWEKLLGERLALQYRQDFALETRIARFHYIFGPLGTWEGGREKAPAAICRKFATVELAGGPLEVWGDGEQTRSFCYIDDCVEGIQALMRSDYREPLNLGQDRLISINGLVDLVAQIAGFRPEVKHIPGPEGVRGRNSDNSRCSRVLGWSPKVTLESGLSSTYAWIREQVRSKSQAAVS